MSPSNVGNFVHDLVEMAKAMETLPQVQAELQSAQAREENLSAEINRLKADLEQSRTYAASLEQRNHDLEVARDDAELRFLELDEKAHSVSRLLLSIRNLAEDGDASLNPPKPEPKVEEQPQPPQADQVASQDQSASDPSNSQAGSSQDTHGVASQAPQPALGQGQGEINPSPVPVATSVSTEAPTVSAGDAASQQASSGPYAGRTYHDYPGYVSRDDWKAGGGTDESYDWRPAPEVTRYNPSF